MVPMMITNMPAGYIAIRLGAKGPNMAVVTACASSTHSMGEAYNCIMRGDADVMITGGVEAAISPLATAGFSSLKALSGRNDDPKHASRPFDADRDGFVIGEGAGILVFEEESSSLRNTSTRRPAARTSTPRSRATASPATRTTSQRPRPTATEPTARWRWPSARPAGSPRR